MIAFARPISISRVIVAGDTSYMINKVRFFRKGSKGVANIVIEYPDSSMTIDTGLDEPDLSNKLWGFLVVNGEVVQGTQAFGFCEYALTLQVREKAMERGFLFLDDPLDAFR